LSIEHQSFLSTYRLQKEILGQFKLGLLPVILLANSLIDLSLEHQSFLSTYKLKEEILDQFKLGLFPVILLANSSVNSSLNDGVT